VVLGSGLGVLLVVGLIMLAAGLFTGSPLPLPGWPDTVHGEAGNPPPAPVAPTASNPTHTAKPTGTTTTTPAAPATSATTHGNGNGASHRPSKSPGKP